MHYIPFFPWNDTSDGAFSKSSKPAWYKQMSTQEYININNPYIILMERKRMNKTKM